MTISYADLITRLEALGNPENVAGMARFGIKGGRVLGISVVTIRQLAKEIGKNHALALQLWDSGIHEAQILATIIADKKQLTVEQMEKWVHDFDTWDVCDQACGNLFVHTPFVWAKAIEWSSIETEFVKRAGFVLMAQLAVKHKKAANEQFLPLLAIIEREAYDERNFVKKAINWALRQIGKRNQGLNATAIQTGLAIQRQNSKAAKWIASDALRELQDPKIQHRLKA